MIERPEATQPKARTPGSRRISAGQFAFLRSVILGLPLEDSARRCLGPGMDLRLVKRELRWLRTELLAAAKRAHAWGDARALALDIVQLPTGSPTKTEPAPSIEEFRDEFGDFYTEAELLEMFRERYPPTAADRRRSRIARLRERQKRALDTLEHVLVQPPTRQDPPSAWFEPKLAKRIEAVGLDTLGKLADWIAQRGHLWHSVVPKLGAVGAQTIVDWIERNSQALNVLIDPAMQMTRAELIAARAQRAALPPRTQPQVLGVTSAKSARTDSQSGALVRRPERQPLLTQIAPLERLVVPAYLDGGQGTNRIESAQALRADNDVEAIEAWLAAVGTGSPQTARAYRREAERLVLWGVFERGVPMSSLTTEDATAYREFLSNPQPADRWVSRRGAIRLSPAWRPFRGPLSGRSVAYAVTVLTALFDWLVQQHYLVRNIWRGLPRRRTINAAAEGDPDRLAPETGRWLTSAQWSVMRSVLDALGSHEEHQRMRLVCLLAYTTGMRLSELASARIGHLDALVSERDGVGDGSESTDDSPRRDWTFARRVVLRVRGKGNKIRTVPVIPKVEDHLNAYLAARGLPSWVECQELAAKGKEDLAWLRGVPLFGKLRSAPRPTTPDINDTNTEPTPSLTDWDGNLLDPRQEPLSTKRIYQIVRAAFERGEALLRKRGHGRDAEVFAQASTHWLRHTFGRHAISGGVKINVVQTLLGHASLQTTTIYTSDDGNEAWDAVRAFTNSHI